MKRFPWHIPFGIGLSIIVHALILGCVVLGLNFSNNSQAKPEIYQPAASESSTFEFETSAAQLNPFSEG